MALQISSNLNRAIQNYSNRFWKSSKVPVKCLNQTYTSTEWTNLNERPKEKVTDMPPMNEPVRGLPRPLYANFKEGDQKTQVTILPNGLTVASENRFGEFCTVGGFSELELECPVILMASCSPTPLHKRSLTAVARFERHIFVPRSAVITEVPMSIHIVIDSGPRYEVAYPSGISHFLEKLAFNSTKNFPNRDEMISKLEKHGGICDSQASRDTFLYAASAYTSGLNDVIQLLSEAILRPQITPEELDSARQAVHFELETLNMRPEQETILMDMIHGAAYKDNTLGLPRLCPPENLTNIDRDILITYLSNHYTPKRMVVAGVGVEHSRLVEAVQKYFVDVKPIWETESEVCHNKKYVSCDHSIAQYTGGMIQEECDIPQFASAGLPVLSHVMIGLESCSHQDKDFIAMCVLNMMMGGGGSFSAGGPGKGMYTRLYTNVLNRYHWMYSATAYNHAYSDSGLFCIHASAPPTHVRDMAEVLVKELVTMTENISDQELQRSKIQLQSMLLMNLESRPVMFEDIGRQVLASGHRKRPKYFINEIENIKRDHIVDVARRLLLSQPAVAARGDLRKVPSLEYIQAGLMDNQGRIPSARKLSLFR